MNCHHRSCAAIEEALRTHPFAIYVERRDKNKPGQPQNVKHLCPHDWKVELQDGNRSVSISSAPLVQQFRDAVFVA